jgi:hypothetical protein
MDVATTIGAFASPPWFARIQEQQSCATIITASSERMRTSAHPDLYDVPRISSAHAGPAPGV